jgi:hypothetical protein
VSEEHENVNFEGRRGGIDGERGGKRAFIGGRWGKSCEGSASGFFGETEAYSG